MTQLEYAKNNIISGLMKKIAALEGLPPQIVMKKIRDGKIVILANKTRKIKKPCAIGEALRTKINANIGTSTERSAVPLELKKLAAAVKYGADTVMDLSVGKDIQRTRKAILKSSPLPLGTVPIYEIAVEAQKKNGHFWEFDAGDMLEVIRSQARDGVDFLYYPRGCNKKKPCCLKKMRPALKHRFPGRSNDRRLDKPL